MMHFKTLTLTAIPFLMSVSFAEVRKENSDAKITKTLNVTNESEIELAKVAQNKSSNEKVKTFAEHMINEHTNNNKNSMQLVRKLNLKPEKSEISESVKKESKNALSKIKKLEGADFDKAYMAAQVDMHQKALTDLNEKLIPTAKNPELKAMLEKTKNSVTEHLEQAKKIQSTIQ